MLCVNICYVSTCRSADNINKAFEVTTEKVHKLITEGVFDTSNEVSYQTDNCV